jgi:DNA uptake protein ComE-like DNA-binding protein
MIRSSQFRTLSAIAFAILLPVAAQAAGTTTSTTTAPKTTKASHATATHAKHPARVASKTKREPALDINTASKEDLQKLSGITEDLAEKIIAGRPYKSKAELVKKNVLTKAEYGKVRNHVTAKQEKSAETKAPETKTEETKSTDKATPETKTPESGK